MSFLLKRYSYFENETFGRLYHNSDYICDTVEGKDLFLEDSLPCASEKIGKSKCGWIAAPRGKYMMANLFSESTGTVTPVVLECGLFRNVCFFDRTEKENGCICVGTYDYESGEFTDMEAALGKISRILEIEKETSFLIK